MKTKHTLDSNESALKSTGFTQGEWGIGEPNFDNEHTIVCYKDGYDKTFLIASLHEDINGEECAYPTEAEANALLISQAPKMYRTVAALLDIALKYDTAMDGEITVDESNVIESAKELIAQATGEPV